MDEQRKNLLKLLTTHQVIQFGKFTLASGRESDYYVDMKKAITDPRILSQIGEMMAEKIKGERVDKVAGPALGAVPIATAVSLTSGIPMLMIRKSKKGYGTSKLIEGELKQDDRVVVVEDVTTTGNSLLKAVEAVKDSGGLVVRALVAVDREEGARENLLKKGVKLEPLVTKSDFSSYKN
ncbi:orotate phosphoribosyltransferase [Methanobacterium sp. CWC-01]|uniref:orotate phosphoribosyltransferase n=1 Tax=Methanobacterium aridiramus TaxID=2584467 RepID=UPI002578EA2B|nr:orotate phosphoribosyltransferase [Methanobacterium sp. CWC-01]